MVEAEINYHLGYEKSERSNNDNYCNGYKRKRENSNYSSMKIDVPQDRKSTFEPQLVKKHQKISIIIQNQTYSSSFLPSKIIPEKLEMAVLIKLHVLKPNF